MIGKKFGRLLVVSQAPSKDNRSQWNCLCDCGITCVANGRSIRQGKRRSCGCLKREVNKEKIKIAIQQNILPAGEASFNLLYATYRSSANARKLEFSLSKEEFKKLLDGDCFYCGKQPFAVHKPQIGGGYLYNGVDRQKNELGYVIGNVVSCCKYCNWMKSDFIEELFIQHCFDIVSYQTSKNLS
jgi:hypothetical protein